jgi:hypothetical protein
VEEVPLDAGAVAVAAAAGLSCDAVVAGPPIRNLSFQPTLKINREQQLFLYA